MKQRTMVKTAVAGTAFAAVILGGILLDTSPGQAHDKDGDTARVELGLAIAPVPLNLQGKDRALVGMGSYLVNAAADCIGCHTFSPATEFAPGRNPYFGQPKQLNATNYLGGGRDFGPLLPNSPNIVSRNLTPDKTGMPAGHTFAEFYQIVTTGIDMDKVHPACSATVTTNCLPPPFQGALLQVMAWPAYQNLPVEDLRAIYEYLSAIPCIEGGPGEPLFRCR